MSKQVPQYAFPASLSGEEIRLLRQQLHMTQRQLASFLNVSPKTVEHWEGGEKEVTGPLTVLYCLFAEHPERAERYRIPEKEFPLRLYYYFRNRLCTLIDVDEGRRLVRIRNYTENPQFRAFGVEESPDFARYEEFLESRCLPRTRDKMKLVLRELELPFYDPLLIIEKTEGRMAEDEFWIRLER